MTIDGWTVTITAEAEADPGKMFYAFPYRNYIFDDDFQVTVNSKHLLSAGKSTANDRTADVIGAVASLIPAVAGLKGTRAGELPPNHNSFLVSFRTNRPKEFQDAQELLRTRRIVLGPLSQPPFTRELNKKEKDQGLVFRLAEPYTISLTYPAEVGEERSDAPLQPRFHSPRPPAICPRISSSGVCEEDSGGGIHRRDADGLPREFAQPHSGSAGDSQGDHRCDCAARWGWVARRFRDGARGLSASGNALAIGIGSQAFKS